MAPTSLPLRNIIQCRKQKAFITIQRYRRNFAQEFQYGMHCSFAVLDTPVQKEKPQYGASTNEPRFPSIPASCVSFIYNHVPHILFHPLFGLVGIKVLLQVHTQFFAERLELFEVLIILSTVLDFRFNTYFDKLSASFHILKLHLCSHVHARPCREFRNAYPQRF
jgi:hypothetical protein